jgi:hypothetical protein
MDRSKTKRLIALLHAQRTEATVRSGLLRESTEWARSSTRLDALNDEIMRVGTETPLSAAGDNDPGADRGDRSSVRR